VPICGVVLYGSHAQARMTEASDLDLLVLSPAVVTGGLWGQAARVEVDAHARNLDAMLAAPLEDWLHVAGGRVLQDASGRLAGWIERLDARRVGGRPEVPGSTLLRDRVWAGRMLRRIARNAARVPGLARLQLGALLGRCPRSMRRSAVGGWLADRAPPGRAGGGGARRRARASDRRRRRAGGRDRADRAGGPARGLVTRRGAHDAARGRSVPAREGDARGRPGR